MKGKGRACSVGRWWLAMHLSIQRSVRWVASSKRSGPTWTEETTSSSAIMMSAPMLFWMAMLRSGVSSMRSPVVGDWKVTPSSVISARSRRETIWKPPLSVSIPRFHPMKRCSPPTAVSRSGPGLLPRW